MFGGHRVYRGQGLGLSASWGVWGGKGLGFIGFRDWRFRVFVLGFEGLARAAWV